MAKNKKRKKQCALMKETMLADRYQIIEVLGQNGLSITYKAYDTFREQTIAMKELYPAAIVARSLEDGLNVECVKPSDEQLFEEMKQSYIQKAKKMIKLYPLEGMANIIHYIEENNTTYMVMEYIEGISLPTFFEKKHASRMELDKTIEMLNPVIKSMIRIHKAGLFHGRISPDCIVLDSKRNAYLLGFGDPMEEVAQDVFGNNTAREFAFSPLEQYVPNESQGAVTDVYALGAVVYLCVTGVWPPAFFERVSEVTGQADPLKAPKELGIPIMKEQSDAIMKALSIYTFERFQNVSDFIDALGLSEFKEEESTVLEGRLKRKYALFVRKAKLKRVAGIVAILVALAVIIPVGIRVYRGQKASSFYHLLEGADLYEKCVMLSELSENDKSIYCNNYTNSTDDNQIVVKYYNYNTGKMMNFKECAELQDKRGQHYVSIDYRKDNRVFIREVVNAEYDSYEIQLEPYGSYYLIEHNEINADGSEKREELKVSREEPEGK